MEMETVKSESGVEKWKMYVHMDEIYAVPSAIATH